jgi:hypothetical protein
MPVCLVIPETRNGRLVSSWIHLQIRDLLVSGIPASLKAGIRACLLLPIGLGAIYMLEEERGVLTSDESGGKRGWKVFRSVVPCGLTPAGERLNSLRQLGHLRLLKGALDTTGTEEQETQATLPQEEPIDTGGGPMAKRQQHNKRALSIDPEPGEAPGVDANADIPNVKREFILTQSADETLREVVRLFSKATGANLTNSHFFRVLLKTVAHAMPELKQEAPQVGTLKRPSNAREGQAAREEYERAIAKAVVAALRSSPPFDASSGDSRKGKGPGKRSA